MEALKVWFDVFLYTKSTGLSHWPIWGMFVGVRLQQEEAFAC